MFNVPPWNILSGTVREMTPTESGRSPSFFLIVVTDNGLCLSLRTRQLNEFISLFLEHTLNVHMSPIRLCVCVVIY
jgi:hypothetical protein